MNKYTIDELHQRQALPLSMKIAMTKTRIRDWISEFGTDGVYISFSGGKDSTVLLDLVRNECGFFDVEAVFCDTGLEFPEIRDFVKTFDNVTWLKPKMNFRQIIEQYGYPVISKDVAQRVFDVRTQARINDCDYKETKLFQRHFDEESDYCQKNPSFCSARYKYLLDAPFLITSKCCSIMKKDPSKAFEKQSGKKPMVATMASESRLRTQKWLKEGCNAFDSDRPISKPMSFWTEQDVLLYIKEKNLPICSVYGDIVVDDGINDGQMCIGDYASECGLFDIGNPNLTTTGAKRTGCMYCMFGCTIGKGSKWDNFERMKETHPQVYDYCMRPWEEEVEYTNPDTGKCEKVIRKGLGYKEVIDWLNEHGKFNIKY